LASLPQQTIIRRQSLVATANPERPRTVLAADFTLMIRQSRLAAVGQAIASRIGPQLVAFENAAAR
jgi:hypothetical protein